MPLDGASVTKTQQWKPFYMTAYIILFSFMGYAGTYSWRVAQFMLPSNYSARPAFHLISGNNVELQASFGLFYAVGNIVGKPFGVWLFASQFTHQNKAFVIISLSFLAALFSGIPIYIFDSVDGLYPSSFLQSLGFGFSALFNSSIWGGFLLFLEGRANFNLFIAFMGLSFVLGGGFWRFMSSSFLSLGIPARLMPLLIAAVGFPFTALGVIMLNRVPKQSKTEQEKRGLRGPMSNAAMLQFTKKYGFPIAMLFISYAGKRNVESMSLE